MSYLLILLLIALFPLPWIWLGAGRSFRDCSDIDWIDGICVGFGIAFCVLYLCSQHSLSLFRWVWGMSLVVAIGVARVTMRRKAAGSVKWGSEIRILIPLLALYLLIRAVPLAVTEYPRGWDPYFHLVLAEKIVRAGKFITDWTPFENIELNYPITSHLLLALVAEIGRVPVHTVFRVAIILFTGLTGAQLYALMTRATGKPEIGLYAALSYLFLALWGSLDYSRWGGLPNLTGMYLVLGLLSILHRKDLADYKIIAHFAILFMAASLVHHHVMLTAGCILLWQLFYFRWFHYDDIQVRRLRRGLAVSAVIGSPYFFAYLRKTAMLKETGLIGYVEGLASPATIMNVIGPAFFFTVVFGALIFFARESSFSVSRSVQQTILILLITYVLLQVSYIVSRVLIGRVIAPFAPSRFLTDSVTLLSVFSAVFFFNLKSWTGRSKTWIVGLIIAGSVLNWPMYRGDFQSVIPEERLLAYDWIRTHTPADAIVIDENFETSYLTQRISSSMPIPPSEFLEQATNNKITQEIKKGRIPPEVGRRQILFVTKDSLTPFGTRRELWSHPSGLQIIEVKADEIGK